MKHNSFYSLGIIMLASLSILNCLLYYRLWLWFDTEQIPIATISSAYNFCTYPCPFCKIRKSDLRNLGIVRNQGMVLFNIITVF